VRNVLNNPLTWKVANYTLVVNNSRGAGMDVNEEVAQRMILDSAELGMEMFHLDAGWFRAVGDWYPHPQKWRGFQKGSGVLQPGWDWYGGNGQPEARPNCWASVSGAIRTCARCSFTEHEPGLTSKTRKIEPETVDGRIGNQSCTQRGHCCDRQQAGQNQLGSFGQRE